MNTLEIHDFTTDHLNDAGMIALQQWKGEAPEMPEKMCPLIYQYLVRYYYVPDSPFSLGATENGKLCAFLLAAPASHADSALADQWISGQLNNKEEEDFFQDYKAYLDGNSQKEQNHALTGEVALLLFASIRKGAGRTLLAEFEKRCRKHGIPSFLLWTDETCDFDYYYKNGFSEAAKFPTNPPLGNQTLTTYLFRKTIKSV